MKLVSEEVASMLKGLESLQGDPEYRAKTAEHYREQELQERAERDKRFRELLAEQGLPQKDILRILGGGCKDTAALTVARQFADSAHRILVLSGGPGCGKTFAAGWLVAQQERFPGARFLDVSRLLRMNRYSEAAMTELERCSLLAIDDLGSEYVDAKGAWLSLLDGLVNARYAADLRTVITTNVPAARFKEQYGERIADRIREVGRFVGVDGESLRGKQ